MKKWRLGAVPVVVVKIPKPELTVQRSSQYGMNAIPLAASGRQVLVKVEPAVVNCSVPFESTLAAVKGWP